MQRGSKKNRFLDFWVGIPLLNVMAILHHSFRRRAFPKSVRKVGMMCSPALGDTLLFSAVVQDSRAWFDQQALAVEIVHFCTRQNLAAAELISGVDRRVVLDLTRPIECVRQMRAEAPDLLLDFTSWQRLTAFLSMQSKIPFTIGFETAGQYRSRGYDRRVEHRADRHELENLRAILQSVGISVGADPRVTLPAAGLQVLPDAEDLVVFHPWASGTRSWLREWPEERWIALAKRLAKAGTVFVVTGAPGDLHRIEPFVTKMHSDGLATVSFVGSDGFLSLGHLLCGSRVVVSVNTGVMHLAAVLGAATVSINGPNCNARWGPIGRFALGVESPGPGCGYLHLGFEFDGRATDCMDRITVDMVFEAAEVMTARRNASAMDGQGPLNEPYQLLSR